MKQTARRIALQVAAILLVGGVAAAVHASLRPVSVYGKASPAVAPATGPAAPGAGEDAPEPGNPRIAEITVKQARTLFDEGRAVFIDARQREDYEAGHVSGAFWLPFSKFFSGKPPELIDDLPKDQPIVVYCEGGDCHASNQVADMLLDYGFTDLRVMAAGWPAWKEAGYPTENGEPLYGS